MPCPYEFGGGGIEAPCCPGKGEVMGATLGVDFRGGALLTRGTSFQFSMFFIFAAGVIDGVEDLGGPPMGGGGTIPPVKLG